LQAAIDLTMEVRNHEALAEVGHHPLDRVIRHPSYLGLLLGLFGWALLFRSAIGVLVSLLLLPPLIARMNSEEALLESGFGEQYSDYRRRTWRLLPFVY
jgi:protein-S-isoprenylcysteine O-methyltransferase Ste14